MQTEERFKLLLTATPGTLAAVDAVLVGKKSETEQPASLRLLKMGEAARETGLSRCTLWRSVKSGKLKPVEIRKGSYRISETELQRFVEGR